MLPYVDIHTHYKSDEGVLSINSHRLGVDNELPPPPFSAGIHPWDVTSVDLEAQYIKLSELKPIAIGEIGLDNTTSCKTEQTEAFKIQLTIAERYVLPVIIHCVKAFEETMSILADYKLKGVVFHGYIGSVEQTERVIREGYYISLGQRSLNSARTIESLKKMPLDRIFAESDDKDIFIGEIYKKISDTIYIPSDTLKEIIYKNYNTLFG